MSMMMISVPTGVAVLALIALIFFLSSLFGGLIGPIPRYKQTSGDDLPANDSDHFLEILEALTDAEASSIPRPQWRC